MIEFLIIMAWIAGYSAIAGLVGIATNNRLRAKCDRSYHDWEACGHPWVGIVTGAFWPVGLPVAGGIRAGNLVASDTPHLSRVERRRRTELEEIDHKIALARKEADLTAALEHEAYRK